MPIINQFHSTNGWHPQHYLIYKLPGYVSENRWLELEGIINRFDFRLTTDKNRIR